ncbi:MAG: phosphomannomutase/phosphoglucomutase [Dictyoglomus sp.]|nr:phosphomannomutase/phosphoglucomutase [Dictyoglomus sp.]MDW8188499.1 phosphomannomutase/phosphoglucomutase [Dictyoglomus sp.]
MNLDRNIFRMYDIRGEVDKNLTEEVVNLVGKAYGIKLKEKIKKENLKVSVGHDVRLSSKRFSEALIDGITSQGIDVVFLGLIPTPVLYFSLFNLPVDGGIMITGSHNPPQFNGMKICIGKETIFGEEIQDLYRIAMELKENAKEKGKVENFDILSIYKDYLIKEFSKGPIKELEKDSLKIVVDSGNGCGGLVIPEVLRKLGVNVIDLFSNPDGNFPNHHPDPTVVKTLIFLKETVIKEKADFGVAYDGDADRIGVIDEKGEVVYGDKLTYIFGKDILKNIPKGKIVGEVKCSKTLFDGIEKLGGIPILSPVGHSLIKKKLKEENALLAGEMSGHIFFNDRYYGYDDALYATLRLVEIYAREKQKNPDFKFSQLLSDLPKVYVSPEIRVHCPDDKKFEVIKNILPKLEKEYPEIYKDIKKIITIDGIRVEFSDGWALARASNTEPVIVMRFEAENEEKLNLYRKIFEETLGEENNL